MAIRGAQGRVVADTLRVSRPTRTVRVQTMDQAKRYWQSLGTPAKGKFLMSRSSGSRYISAGPG